MIEKDLEQLHGIELDLTNLLKSFGIDEEQAEQIDKMIDATIDNQLRLNGIEQ